MTSTFPLPTYLWLVLLLTVAIMTNSDAPNARAADGVALDLQRRHAAANAQNRKEWEAITNRQEWEAYRDERLKRLRKSLGPMPTRPEKLNVHISNTVEGDGYCIENLAYESRPGDWVTGNLYVPTTPSKSMPGIIIAHAHHTPKDDSELQDMGMLWARAGCLVLVIDQVGHGERHAHPFTGPESYPKRKFKHWRQDYYFRYDSGLQLQLVGESLMGWMVWDLMRGVDLLLARKDIDPKRIILLGAVAGGGDPCAVTAALDRRIAAAVPFNFGGPQPESILPTVGGDDARYDYLMDAYWESTRCLRRTAVDGFFDWTVVAGIAPRRLIYAHEFAWDRDRDPVWKRFQKIYGEFYAASDRLAVTHGRGTLTGTNPRGSHCTHIERLHREMIHPVFQRWFDIEVTSDDGTHVPRAKEDLICLTPTLRKKLNVVGFVQRVSDRGQQRVAEARGRRAKMSALEQRESLRRDWARLLGDVQPVLQPTVVASEDKPSAETDRAGLHVQRVVLEVDAGVTIPMLLLSNGRGIAERSADASARRQPVVVGLAQGGKDRFRKDRADGIEALVRGGALVCLPDLRGTGENKASRDRDRTSADTDRSVDLLRYGPTMLGQRLSDLRSVIAYLRDRKDVDAEQIALWGDSFAPVNPIDTDFDVPRNIRGRPHQPEPLGGLVALLGGLFDEKIARVYVHGGLSSFQSMLTTPHVLMPHDVIVPGALTAGDVCDVVGAIAPRPVRLDTMVDGLDRPVSPDALRREFDTAERAWGASQQLVLDGSTSAASWLLGEVPANHTSPQSK